MPNEQHITDMLERMVELYGLPKTLDMLADICAEKAEHKLARRRSGEGLEQSLHAHSRTTRCTYKVSFGRWRVPPSREAHEGFNTRCGD
jgi:hypothetical protein